VGPGLGLGDWAKNLLERVLESDLPVVVDADALNILSQNPRKRENWILTPHPGEAAKLLGVINPVIQSQRLDSLDKLVKKYGGTIVLKGNNTLVGGPNQIPYLVRTGNPGMASAGMGDLLTGIVAGLLGQFENIDHQLLAAIAANAHATAGDLAAGDGERGLIATDLFKYLKQHLNP
jgi:NAD(P)H-hydrate epimerase